MQSKFKRRGAGALVVIIGLVVLIVVALGGWYLVSAPFKTRVDMAVEQGTKWTPENIQKDPVGYLTWALGEVRGTKEKLEASVLSLKTKKNAASRGLDKNTADKTEYEKLLNEFKEAFKTASADGKWPVKVRDFSFDENALKRKIVEVNDKLGHVTSLEETYTRTRSVIDRKLGELDGKLSEVVKLESKLSTDLEIAKVNESVEGIGSIGDQLNAIIDTSEALVSTTEEGVSVEEMIKPSGDARIEDEFKKIMGN